MRSICHVCSVSRTMAIEALYVSKGPKTNDTTCRAMLSSTPPEAFARIVASMRIQSTADDRHAHEKTRTGVAEPAINTQIPM